jgi:hypothetical protein
VAAPAAQDFPNQWRQWRGQQGEVTRRIGPPGQEPFNPLPLAIADLPPIPEYRSTTLAAI